MSDNKQYRENSSEEEWIGSFYGSSKSSNNELDIKQKKINTIDKRNHKDGKLANSRRDISALSYILRLFIVIIILIIFFGLIIFGIFLYKERLLVEKKQIPASAVMSEAIIVKTNDLNSLNNDNFFKNQCSFWEQESNDIRKINELYKFGYIQQALDKCNVVLNRNPYKQEVLLKAADIFLELNRPIEAVNAYIRLINLNQNDAGLIEKLIKALFELGDHRSVINLSDWYYTSHVFNEDIHHLMYQSFIKVKEYNRALEISERFTSTSKYYIDVINKKIEILINEKRYGDAILCLEIVSQARYREPSFYRDYSRCYAKLGDVKSSVEILGKAANIFGQSIVLQWILSDDYELILENSYFKAFSSRIGGQQLASQMNQLSENPNDESFDNEGLLINNTETFNNLAPQLDIMKRD